MDILPLKVFEEIVIEDSDGNQYLIKEKQGRLIIQPLNRDWLFTKQNHQDHPDYGFAIRSKSKIVRCISESIEISTDESDYIDFIEGCYED